MKKGYVLDIGKDFVTVMARGGETVKVKKRQPCEVGENILFSQKDVIKTKEAKKTMFGKIKPYGFAAALVLVLVSALFIPGALSSDDEAAYVLSMDINPSIQVEVSDGFLVLSVEAKNEEGAQLELEEFEGEPLKDLLYAYVDRADEKRFLTEETKDLILGYVSKLDSDDVEELEEYIEETAIEVLERVSEMEVFMMLGEKEQLEQARESSHSLGVFLALEMIQSYEEEMEEEEREGLAVGRMMDHPVFGDRHPGNWEEDGYDHPVFDKHPGTWEEDDEREHPIFKVHPRNWAEGHREHPVFDTHPGDREEGEDGERRHPVFDEGEHPRDRNKGEDRSHPIFETHPRDQERDEDEGTNGDNGDNGEEGRNPVEAPPVETPPVEAPPVETPVEPPVTEGQEEVEVDRP